MRGCSLRAFRLPAQRIDAESGMKFTGDIAINAPREAVFAKVRDAQFFASCMEGVRDLNEIDRDRYTAVLETKLAYLKFTFNVMVEVVRADAPKEIEAKIEGTPSGTVGRFTARALTRLAEDNGGTKVSYEIEAALTGKLGSLGQPALRAKAKEMERLFAERVRAAFTAAEPETAT
jgi:carbon monoxide dehydrogenase subunit G